MQQLEMLDVRGVWNAVAKRMVAIRLLSANFQTMARDDRYRKRTGISSLMGTRGWMVGSQVEQERDVPMKREPQVGKTYNIKQFKGWTCFVVTNVDASFYHKLPDGKHHGCLTVLRSHFHTIEEACKR